MRKGRTAPADEIVLVNAHPHPLRDAYHLVLRIRFGWLLVLIAAFFLVVNALFAAVYVETGGIQNAAPGSFRDAFFFSVQTMGTIGYGAMYPTTSAANAVVTAESVVSMIIAALVTGVVFARFSQSRSQLVFSDRVAISPMNGVPTLSFRVGNDRASTVFEARIRVSLIRTEKTDEGMIFYRLVELPLVRESSQVLARSWTVMHQIDQRSPLYQATPESCDAQEVEIIATIVGTDDTSLQPVHGRTRYDMKDVVWGARLADVLSELPDGRMQLDLGKFDDLVPTEPTPDFPYPSITSAA